MDKSNFEEIKPFVRFFQIIGLHYFPFPKTEKQIRTSKRYEPKFFIYFLVLAGIVLSCFILQIVMAPGIKKEDSRKTAVQKTIQMILYYGFFLTAGISLYQSISTVVENQEMFKNFEEISTISLSKAFFFIDYKEFKRQFRVKFFGTIFIFVSLLFTVLIMDKISKRMNKSANPAFTTIPLFIVKFGCLKFLFYAELINFNLTAVKRVLETPCINVLKIQDSFEEESYRRVKLRDDYLVETLTVAKTMYGLVWECTELMNCCFGWTLLMLYMFIAMGLIVVGYNVLMLIQVEAQWSKYTGNNYMVLILIYILNILAITYTTFMLMTFLITISNSCQESLNIVSSLRNIFKKSFIL